MLQSGKQVFMYFSDKPIPTSKMNGNGYEKIQAFRDKYKDRRIYFTYSSDEEKQKYWKNKKLYEIISKALEWAPVKIILMWLKVV